MKKLLLISTILGITNSLFSQTCDVTLPIFENFDDSNVINVCWNLNDQDGDGNKWYWYEYSAFYGGHKCITSNSFYTSTGALNPDNWIISHPIDLNSYSNADNIILSWKVRGELTGFAHEYYSIYAATTSDITNFESSPVKRGEYVDDVGGEGVFVTRTLDLSSLAGEIVYVAFRHHNSSNQYSINIDDIELKLNGTLGIDDYQQNSFKHYYNANTNILTIDSNDVPMDTIQIYNILGQSVLNKKLHQSKESISLSNMVDGIYIIHVKLNGIHKTFKFIKY